MVASKELPAYIVRGSNWVCDVCLDEDDAELPVEGFFGQTTEAATKCIEKLKGVSDTPLLVLDNDNEEPYISSILEVTSKATNEGFFVETYVALLNGGFYRDAELSYLDYLKDMQDIESTQKELQSKGKESKTKNTYINPETETTEDLNRIQTELKKIQKEVNSELKKRTNKKKKK